MKTKNFMNVLGTEEMRVVNGGFWEPTPDDAPRRPWEIVLGPDWKDIFIYR